MLLGARTFGMLFLAHAAALSQVSSVEFTTKTPTPSDHARDASTGVVESPIESCDSKVSYYRSFGNWPSIRMRREFFLVHNPFSREPEWVERIYVDASNELRECQVTTRTGKHLRNCTPYHEGALLPVGAVDCRGEVSRSESTGRIPPPP